MQAATEHARFIARRITQGDSDPYTAVPWFWSDQADWKLQIAGLAYPDDASVCVDDSTVLRFRNDRLCAVETINNARIHMQARRLLALQERPSQSLLAAQDYDLLAV